MPLLAVHDMQHAAAGAADAVIELQDAERHPHRLQWDGAGPKHVLHSCRALKHGWPCPQPPLGVHGRQNIATLVGPTRVVLPWLQGRLPLLGSGQQVGAASPGPPPSGAALSSQRRCSQQHCIRRAGFCGSGRQTAHTPHAGASQALAQTAVPARRPRSGGPRGSPCSRRGGCQA